MCLERKLPLGEVPKVGYKLMLLDAQHRLRFIINGELAPMYTELTAKSVTLDFIDGGQYQSGFHVMTERSKVTIEHPATTHVHVMKKVFRKAWEKYQIVPPADLDLESCKIVMAECELGDVYEHGVSWDSEAYVCKRITITDYQECSSPFKTCREAIDFYNEVTAEPATA